jgi:hypothetical protein
MAAAGRLELAAAAGGPVVAEDGPGEAKVKDAPKIDTDGHLLPQEEQELCRYYGLYYGLGNGTAVTDTTTSGTSGLAGTAGSAGGCHDLSGEAGIVGHHTSGPTTDNAMTRSEERLNVGTRTEEAGRARLRKYIVTENYVVTENVTETVPVSREEVRVEREPITDANIGNAMDGPAISEEEHEVTVHAERPVVGQGGRAGRARPPRHADRHRVPADQRHGTQGADRARRRLDGRRSGPQELS